MKMLKRESARDWMKARIAHSLPGRLRLVVPGLEYIQAERRELAAELAGIAGVRRARINVPTAGVLLEYDPKRLDAPAMLERANLVDIAPTLARALGLELPQAQGRALDEVFL